MLKKIKRGVKKIMKDAVELVGAIMDHSAGKILYDDLKKIISKATSSDVNIRKTAVFIGGSVLGSVVSAVATTFIK